MAQWREGHGAGGRVDGQIAAAEPQVPRNHDEHKVGAVDAGRAVVLTAAIGRGSGANATKGDVGSGAASIGGERMRQGDSAGCCGPTPDGFGGPGERPVGNRPQGVGRFPRALALLGAAQRLSQHVERAVAPRVREREVGALEAKVELPVALVDREGSDADAGGLGAQGCRLGA